MRDIETLRKEKYNSLNILLKDEYLLAHVDTAAKDVILPEPLYVKRSVTLRLSRFFKGYIKVTEEKVVTELVFGENRFSCHIPINAIWGYTSMRGSNIVWPESAPPGLIDLLKNSGNLIKIEEQSEREKEEAILKEIEEIKKQTKPEIRPELKAVKNEVAEKKVESETVKDKAEKIEGKLPARPQLKRIK